MLKKKVKYKVECVNNPEHIFEKVIEIIEGKETEIQAFCPWCEELVNIKIQGKPAEEIILRKFKENK